MDAATASAKDDFVAHLRAALQYAEAANTGKTVGARQRIFDVWRTYCTGLGIEPSLARHDAETRLCHLLAFGMRYRPQGQTGRPVKADSVENALLAVGEGITHLGQPDP